MAPSLPELAEHTEVHLLPRAGYGKEERDGFVYLTGPRTANLHPYALDDVEGAVAWSREEARANGRNEVEWWIGWTAQPPDLAARLLACGIPRSTDPPTLTGMISGSAPPLGPPVEVQRIETLEDYLEAVEVDFVAWSGIPDDVDERRQRARDSFDAMMAAGTVHHFSALLDGERVGFGRAIDMENAVALFGGAVLPEARGRGVYRALVQARWEHAVARGTPTLVVQAGPMSGPILIGLGFERYGEIELYVDRL